MTWLWHKSEEKHGNKCTDSSENATKTDFELAKLIHFNPHFFDYVSLSSKRSYRSKKTKVMAPLPLL
jgi:hypothetical protein